MKKALKISTNNVREVVEFDNSTSYDTIRTAVGGWIECVRIPSLNVEMWVNEEGKLSDDPIQNPTGTALWVDNYGETDVIIGDIIFTSGTDANGHTLGLSDEQLNSLLNYTKTAFVENLEITDFTGFTIAPLDV